MGEGTMEKECSNSKIIETLHIRKVSVEVQFEILGRKIERKMSKYFN